MPLSLAYEKRLWRQGYLAVAGVDEVGRGAWAGPLVAAAVMLNHATRHKLRGLNWVSQVADSKLLSPLKRQAIAAACGGVVGFAYGVVNNKVIDEQGVAQANQRAVQLAIMNLHSAPQFTLVDYVARLGNRVAGVPAITVVDGDAKVFCIALASILAKVERDRLMTIYDARYPGYGFAKHKGYGTLQHSRALRKQGVCALHRVTYRPVAAFLV